LPPDFFVSRRPTYQDGSKFHLHLPWAGGPEIVCREWHLQDDFFVGSTFGDKPVHGIGAYCQAADPSLVNLDPRDGEFQLFRSLPAPSGLRNWEVTNPYKAITGLPSANVRISMALIRGWATQLVSRWIQLSQIWTMIRPDTEAKFTDPTAIYSIICSMTVTWHPTNTLIP
jgi:hypothetical protein